MIEIQQQKLFQFAKYQWRGIAMQCVVFFLVTSILTAVFIIPKINGSIQENYEKGLQVDSKLEAELFIRFVESHRVLVSDISMNPSLTNAVMLSSGENTRLIELLDNITIKGKKGRIVLQDIAGNILFKTTHEMQDSYTRNASWLNKVLNGNIPYHFQLLEQKEDQITFKISVPVAYAGNIEGVLSAEISAPLDQLFVAQLFDEFVALKLIQDHVIVETNADKIKVPKETLLEIKKFGLTFIYISDQSSFLKKTNEIRNSILTVLFIGLTVSFILFFTFSYKALAQEVQIAKKTLWSRAYAIPALVCIIGLVASITAYFMATNIQRASLEWSFISTAKDNIKSIRTDINQHLEVLQALKSLYNASTFVDRQEFKDFSKPFLERHPNIQALKWVPRAHEDRLTDFTLTDKNATDKLTLAHDQEQYYSIYNDALIEKNKVVQALEPFYYKEHYKAITQARDTGKIVSSHPIQLTHNNISKVGYLFFAPVYEGTSDYTNADLRKQHFMGLALLVLLADDLIANAISDAKPMDMFIEDISDTHNTQSIVGAKPDSKLFFYSNTVDFSGRSLRIIATPQQRLSDIQWLPIMVLMTGTVFSILMGWLLIHQIRRRELVEITVEERTAELMELQQAMQLAIEGVSKIDPEGRYIYVNEAYAGKIGYTPEELVGKKWGMTIAKNQQDKMNDAYQMMLKDGKVVAETIGQHKDGSTLHKQVTMISDFNKQGAFIGHFCFMQDITERKDGELEREKLINRLVDSNEKLERFAFVCSHDLQEPLRMIRSFSDKLQEHMGDNFKNDEKGIKYFRFITDGATRAQQLIAAILTYSSIDSDTQALEEVNSEELIQVIKENMHLILEERDGKITYDNLPLLKGNKTQIFQILQNLINNGFKYQEPDSSPHVHVGVEDAGEFWQFSIKDNGIGMEERHFKKIFDVFQRLHRKSQYAGTGVGLAICKKVAERHGGKIWLDSEKGVGSTFYFTILKPTLMEDNHDQEHQPS